MATELRDLWDTPEPGRRRTYFHQEREVDERKERLRCQREADWEATHLNSECHTRRVLDGEVGAPSWWHGDTSSFQRHLRSLGYRSSQEEEYERLKFKEEFGGRSIVGTEDW